MCERNKEYPKRICKTVPIIAMTASAFSEDVNKAKQCGMTGFLTKPVNSDELSRTLTQAVSEENV